MSDSEYEEEEILVFANFADQLVPEELENENAAMKVIGIEDAHPMAEINDSIFKGSYNFAMGTCVFFEKDNEAKPTDPLFETPCKQFYKYFNKTTKVINFERIYVEKIKDPLDQDAKEQDDDKMDDDDDDELDPEIVEKLRVNLTYEQLIQQFPAAKAKAQSKFGSK